MTINISQPFLLNPKHATNYTLDQCFPTGGAIRKWTRHVYNPFAPGHLNAMVDFGAKFNEKSKFLNNINFN